MFLSCREFIHLILSNKDEVVKIIPTACTQLLGYTSDQTEIKVGVQKQLMRLYLVMDESLVKLRQPVPDISSQV